MEIAKIYVTSDVQAEIVMNDKFKKLDSVTQKDLIKDMIGDLTSVYDLLYLDNDFSDVMGDFSEEENEVNFVLQRKLYSE